MPEIRELLNVCDKNQREAVVNRSNGIHGSIFSQHGHDVASLKPLRQREDKPNDEPRVAGQKLTI